MPQEYGHRANLVQEAQEFECLVCNTRPVTWTWGDVHGEAMCTMCGTPYQLLQYEEDDDGKKQRLDAPPRLNIKDSWIPILQQYWEETRQFTGLANIMIWGDYPECKRGQEAFYAWVDEHPELMPEA